MRDRYGAKTVRAQSLRFHTQPPVCPSPRSSRYNNVVRTAVEALAAIFGGTNSLHTNALDETLALPTEESADCTAHSAGLAEETGVVNVDPLGGSWYVEALTDKIEAEVVSMLDRIEELGGGSARQHEIGPITSGLLLGIEEGWFTGQIADSAFRYQTELEKGDKKIVGVNVHTTTVTRPLEILRVSHEVEVQQSETLRMRRSARDKGQWTPHLRR